MTYEEQMELVTRTAAQLGEYFDAVQILCSTQEEGGGTVGVSRGCGNWYARIGMARELLDADTAEGSARRIAAKLRVEDED